MTTSFRSIAPYFLAALTGASIGCSHKKHASEPVATGGTATVNRPKTSIEAKQLAAESEASVVTEIAFAKGKKILSPAAKASLDRAVRNAGIKGEIDDIKVISWGDEEFPSSNTRTLSKQQRELADARNLEIKNYLARNDRKLDIDTFNMAERANAFERMMSTSDARVKRSLETAGIPNSDTSIKVPAKASKSIVMIILKQ